MTECKLSIFATPEQKAYKQGYTKCYADSVKWLNSVKTQINGIESLAIEQIERIPEVFTNLQENEDYNYYSGVLDTLKKVKEILGA